MCTYNNGPSNSECLLEPAKLKLQFILLIYASYKALIKDIECIWLWMYACILWSNVINSEYMTILPTQKDNINDSMDMDWMHLFCNEMHG